MIKKFENFKDNFNKKYYKCECGSETFVRTYNVWNEKIKGRNIYYLLFFIDILIVLYSY